MWKQTSTHPGQPCSAGPWVNVPKNHLSSRHKSAPCSKMWHTKPPRWAFLAHDNFCTVRARSDGQNEARTSSYFSTMAAEHSPHRSTRIKFELVYISGEKPSTACPFLRAEGTRTLTYRAEVTNWRTCGRENVSVNSYVTETKGALPPPSTGCRC